MGLPEQISGLKSINDGVGGNILELQSVFRVLEALSMPQGHTNPKLSLNACVPHQD